MALVDYFAEQLTQNVTDWDNPSPPIESGVRALSQDELQLIHDRMREEYCDISGPPRVHWPLGSRILVYNALYNTVEARGEQGYLTLVASRPVSSKFPFVIDHNFFSEDDAPEPVKGYPESRARVCSEDCWVPLGRLGVSEVGSAKVAVYATTVNPFNPDKDLLLQYFDEKVAFAYYAMEGNTRIAKQIWRSPNDDTQWLPDLDISPQGHRSWVRVQDICWLQEHFGLDFGTEAEVQQLSDKDWQRWLEIRLSDVIAAYIDHEDNLGVAEG